MRNAVLVVVLASLIPAGVQAAPKKANIKGYIGKSCAPWDGPAFHMVLAKEALKPCEAAKGKSLSVSFYQAMPAVKLPIEMDFGRTGALSLCDAKGACQAAQKATVTLDRLERGKGASGTYEYTLKNGKTERGTFEAVWCGETPKCG